MSDSPKVLIIGLDAATPRLVEKWVAEGRLPNLGRSVRLRRLSGLLWLPLWPLYAVRGDSTYGIFVEAVASHA